MLIDPRNTEIAYLGPPPEAGPLPAFFYFSLSAKESLELAPYNQPAALLSGSDVRIFSLTIPGHEEGMNKFYAIQYWAQQMAKGEYILNTFFEKTVHAIEWLVDQSIVDPAKMAIGGLSRGAFVATHIAARMTAIHTVLGFAPLTELMHVKEFYETPALQRQAEELNLIHLVDKLTHIRYFRYYIGNLDTRVSTDACYKFIRAFAEKGHEKKARHQKIELMITQSIGHKGHGTAPQIFEEGSAWLKKHILEGVNS